MKDSIVGRILFYVLLLTVLLMSIGLFIFAIGIIPLNNIEPYLDLYYSGDWLVNVITGIIAIFLFIIAIRLIIPSKKSRKVSGALVKNTELGQVIVSIGTLENLTQNAVKRFDEIKDVNCRIGSEMDGVSIRLKLMVMPDVIIPEITQKIQDEIKEYIERISGINVKEVEIFIDDLTYPQTSRVE